MLLGHRRQLARDHRAQPVLIGQDRLELGDLARQVLALLLQLDDGEPGQAPQLELEDVAGLGLGQVEGPHEALARGGRVLAGADDGDDPVDVDDGGEQPLDQVGALAALAQAEAGAPGDHRQAVAHEDLQQLAQPQGARPAVDQAHVVDAEGVLQGRVPVELGQDRLGVVAVLDPDDQAGAVLAVGQVGDVGDALELLGGDGLLDAGDDLLRAHQVGQLGDDDALLAGGDVLDAGGGAGEEFAPARAVGLPDPVQAHDHAAGGQVRPGHDGHEVLQARLGVGDEVAGGGDDLAEVVRRHVRGHAHRDARGAVDQQVGEGGGQDVGLGEGVVVVGGEVDGVLVDVGRQGQRRGRQARLGVARRGRPVVEGAEVAVAVDERQAHGEGLGQAHERLVDGDVAVRVQAPHDVADDARGLHVGAVGAQPHAVHLEQDAALDGFEAVAGVGQRPGVDDRVGVLQEGGAHLRGEVLLDDEAVGGRRRLRGGLGHAGIVAVGGAGARVDTRG